MCAVIEIVSRIGTPALVRTPIVCRLLVIYRLRHRVLIRGSVSLVLSHHSRPERVFIKYQNPQIEAPMPGKIRIQ